MAKKSSTKKGKTGQAVLKGTLKSTITGGVTNAGSLGKFKTTTPQTPAAQQAAAAATNNAAAANSNYMTPTTNLKKGTYTGGTWDAPNLTEIKPYQESQAVQDLRTRLNPYLDGEGRPTYTSEFNDIIKQKADKIANREDFSYDFNTDPLYQNYRDQYQRQAVLGQQGAMANAAALTGGYGSSYASTAGNLAYQENMSQLNNVIPQLYQMAYDKYNTDLSNQRADLSMYQDLENNAYGRFRDSLSDWNTDRDYYTGRYDTERNQDWNQYRANVDDVHWADDKAQQDYANKKNYTSSEHWNQKNYDQGVKEWKESIRQYNESLKENKRQFDLEYKLSKKAKASGGSGGGYRGRSGSGSTSSRLTQDAYNEVRRELSKYKTNDKGNGNAPQREIAANILNKIAAKYNLNEAQQNRVWSEMLGFKDTPTVKTNTRHDKSKSVKYQTYADIPKKIRDKVKRGKINIMNDEQFVSYTAQNKGKSGYKNYEAYLKAMAKKYGF